uniref:Uncharacterized protein n=1 Tax=Panagrolaimus davidi TaxID=227884 RepID=A0A914PZU4_9BILA
MGAELSKLTAAGAARSTASEIIEGGKRTYAGGESIAADAIECERSLESNSSMFYTIADGEESSLTAFDYYHAYNKSNNLCEAEYPFILNENTHTIYCSSEEGLHWCCCPDHHYHINDEKLTIGQHDATCAWKRPDKGKQTGDRLMCTAVIPIEICVVNKAKRLKVVGKATKHNCVLQEHTKSRGSCDRETHVKKEVVHKSESSSPTSKYFETTRATNEQAGTYGAPAAVIVKDPIGATPIAGIVVDQIGTPPIAAIVGDPIGAPPSTMTAIGVPMPLDASSAFTAIGAAPRGALAMTAIGAPMPGDGFSTFTAVGAAPCGALAMTAIGAPMPGDGSSTFTAVGAAPRGALAMTPIGAPMPGDGSSTITAIGAAPCGALAMTAIGAPMPGDGSSTFSAIGAAPRGALAMTAIGAPMPGDGSSTFTAVGAAPCGASAMTAIGAPMPGDGSSKFTAVHYSITFGFFGQLTCRPVN